MEARAVKIRAYAPALLAVVALVVVYVLSRDSDDDAGPAPVATQQQPKSAPSTSPPQLREPIKPPPPAPTAPTGPPSKPPSVVSADEHAAHEPKAKKPKMTLEEKLEETKKHVVVMERRAQLLEAEIAELEKTGQKDKAAEQRVVLQRLNAHAEKLRQAVAEGREPE